LSRWLSFPVPRTFFDMNDYNSDLYDIPMFSGPTQLKPAHLFKSERPALLLEYEGYTGTEELALYNAMIPSPVENIPDGVSSDGLPTVPLWRGNYADGGEVTWYGVSDGTLVKVEIVGERRWTGVSYHTNWKTRKSTQGASEWEVLSHFRITPIWKIFDACRRDAITEAWMREMIFRVYALFDILAPAPPPPFLCDASGSGGIEGVLTDFCHTNNGDNNYWPIEYLSAVRLRLAAQVLSKEYGVPMMDFMDLLDVDDLRWFEVQRDGREVNLAWSDPITMHHYIGKFNALRRVKCSPALRVLSGKRRIKL
jgi:hypothetical protein